VPRARDATSNVKTTNGIKRLVAGKDGDAFVVEATASLKAAGRPGGLGGG